MKTECEFTDNNGKFFLTTSKIRIGWIRLKYWRYKLPARTWFYSFCDHGTYYQLSILGLNIGVKKST